MKTSPFLKGNKMEKPVKQRIVLGVGINDFKYSISIKGKNIIEYKIWHSMLNRCYNKNYYYNQKNIYKLLC